MPKLIITCSNGYLLDSINDMVTAFLEAHRRYQMDDLETVMDDTVAPHIEEPMARVKSAAQRKLVRKS